MLTQKKSRISDDDRQNEMIITIVSQKDWLAYSRNRLGVEEYSDLDRMNQLERRLSKDSHHILSVRVNDFTLFLAIDTFISSLNFIERDQWTRTLRRSFTLSFIIEVTETTTLSTRGKVLTSSSSYVFFRFVRLPKYYRSKKEQVMCECLSHCPNSSSSCWSVSR